MNWPLIRLIVGWTSGVGLALSAWQATVTSPGAAEWWARHPLSTAGCPGLHAQVAAWQEELSLRDWTIQVECGLRPGESKTLIGRVQSDASPRHATIWIREGMSRRWQESTVVHELAHVIVNAGRAWVPEGRAVEEFVEAAAEDVYFSRRPEIQRRMLGEARRLMSGATSTATPPLDRARNTLHPGSAE